MIRPTQPEDIIQVRTWLTDEKNLLAHTGTDLRWKDFVRDEEPEMSATVAKHVRSYAMTDARDKAMGVVITYPTLDYPWVWNLEIFIAQEARKSGRGFSLLKFAIDDLFRNTFCEVLEGTIAEDNKASLAAFQKFGNIVVGRIEGYFKRKNSTSVAAIRVAMTKEIWNDKI
jgi:hypothetical protein